MNREALSRIPGVKLLPMNDRFSPSADGVSRRRFLSQTLATGAFLPGMLQQGPPPAIPPSQPRDWSGREPTRYPDPDVVALDNRFRRYIVGNTTMKRLYTGTQWVGRARLERRRPLPRVERHPEQRADALDRRRWPRDGVPEPVGLQQRQHLRLRGASAVVRARRTPRRPLRTVGEVTVVAEKFQGKRLNSPNDVVVHPDRSIWFTDPITGFSATSRDSKASRKPSRRSIALTRPTGSWR